jgi:hypothetical protein
MPASEFVVTIAWGKPTAFDRESTDRLFRGVYEKASESRQEFFIITLEQLVCAFANQILIDVVREPVLSGYILLLHPYLDAVGLRKEEVE